MTRPTDIRSDLIWTKHPTGASAVFNPERHWPPCRVYWGTHGCDRPKDHEGPHWCSCCQCENHPDQDSGCVAGPPYYGPETNFYGDDAPEPEQEPA